MDDEEKKPYEKMAQAEQVKYEEAMKQWRQVCIESTVKIAVYANYIGPSVMTDAKFWRVPYLWWKNYWKWPMCYKK